MPGDEISNPSGHPMYLNVLELRYFKSSLQECFYHYYILLLRTLHFNPPTPTPNPKRQRQWQTLILWQENTHTYIHTSCIYKSRRRWWVGVGGGGIKTLLACERHVSKKSSYNNYLAGVHSCGESQRRVSHVWIACTNSHLFGQNSRQTASYICYLYSYNQAYGLCKEKSLPALRFATWRRVKNVSALLKNRLDDYVEKYTMQELSTHLKFHLYSFPCPVARIRVHWDSIGDRERSSVEPGVSFGPRCLKWWNLINLL